MIMKLSLYMPILLAFGVVHSASLLTKESQVYAQNVPSYWPYQGLLFDVNGDPIDGRVNLSVKVYAAIDDVNALWIGSLSDASVRNGTFSIDLGTVGGEQLKGIIERGEAQFIGITVNDGIELTPRTRIGSLPYATLAGNAFMLNGQRVEQFVDQQAMDDLNDRINGVETTANGAQTAAEAAQNTANGVQTAAEAAQNTANGAQTAAEAAQNTANGAQTAAEAAQNTANGAQTAAEAAQNIANGAQTATEAAQNTANGAQAAAEAAQTTANGAQTAAEAAQTTADGAQTAAEAAQTTADGAQTAAEAAQNNVTELQNKVDTLEDTVDELLTTVQTLQNQLATVVAQNSAFILGVSNTTTNGWIRFNDQQGVRAAGEMCKSSFANEPTAHYCSLAEVQEALSVNNYDQSIDGVATWVYSTATPGDNSYCQSMLYFSGHAAVGTSLVVNTTDSSVSGGNGIRLVYNSSDSCSNSRRILCCR